MRKSIRFFLSSLTIFGFCFLGGCFFDKKLFKQEPFACNGLLKTMFFQTPLNLKVDGDSLTLRTYTRGSLDREIIDLFDELEIPIPEINGTYELNVQYSDGFLIKRLDRNKFSVKHFHVNGTLFLDKCILDYPIEINSTEKLLEYADLLQYLFE
tara:strand:+ start:883 stop:1344 length:462 start_codon:yes stop_codon:yes gene_type:complete